MKSIWFNEKVSGWKQNLSTPTDAHEQQQQSLRLHAYLPWGPPETQLHSSPACGEETSSRQTQTLLNHPCWFQHAEVMMVSVSGQLCLQNKYLGVFMFNEQTNNLTTKSGASPGEFPAYTGSKVFLMHTKCCVHGNMVTANLENPKLCKWSNRVCSPRKYHQAPGGTFHGLSQQLQRCWIAGRLW